MTDGLKEGRIVDMNEIYNIQRAKQTRCYSKWWEPEREKSKLIWKGAIEMVKSNIHRSCICRSLWLS